MAGVIPNSLTQDEVARHAHGDGRGGSARRKAGYDPADPIRLRQWRISRRAILSFLTLMR